MVIEFFPFSDRLTAVAKADSPEVGGDPAAGSDPGPEGGDRAREAPSGPLECVCYGLGSFSCCVTARYQLAMLLLILESLQVLALSLSRPKTRPKDTTSLYSSCPTLDSHEEVQCGKGDT